MERRETGGSEVFEIAADINYLKGKIKAGFTVAFLVTSKLELSIARTNEHLEAAKSVGLASNNAKGIIIKGRIIPKNEKIVIQNLDLAGDTFPTNNISPKQLDILEQETVKQINRILGLNFEMSKAKKIKS